MKTLTESLSATPATRHVQRATERTIYSILLMISFSHLLNDTVQSLIPSIYPILKASQHLSFGQLGMITFTFQLTASLLQPFVGHYTDKHPLPYSAAIGMTSSLCGLICLSRAHTYPLVLISVAFVGIGSSIFHPESSRVAYLASGGKRGLAQSVFQLGGNAGSSLGPLLAASIIVPFGQSYILCFCLVALIAIVVLYNVGRWYAQNKKPKVAKPTAIGVPAANGTAANTNGAAPASVITETKSLPRKTVIASLIILLLLIFSKYFYLASMSSYYTFYLMDKFHVSVQNAQVHLFIFLFSVAAGTLIGGPLGDKYGRKYVIWFSILGAAPFTLLLPYTNLFWTGVLTVFIGLILSSAFSAILVYAQELVPGKVGLISGLFFGLAFGMGGLGSAALGKLADATNIQYVYKVCAFLPLIGLLTGFLPNLEKQR
jgi:FSR family fosmidomycin resistance protein-like MFS transporter